MATLYFEEQVRWPENLEKRRWRKIPIHYNSDSATAELLFRMIISVNQLSLYGGVSDWCEEIAQQMSEHSSSSTGRPVAEMNDDAGSRISPNVVSILTNPPSMYVLVQGDFLRSHNKRFENLPEDIRLSKASEDAGYMRDFSWTIFLDDP